MEARLSGRGLDDLLQARLNVKSRGSGRRQTARAHFLPASRDAALPWHASRLHVIGQRHVVRPHVVLPLAEADHAAQDVAGVDADAHVDVDSGGVSNLPVEGGTRQSG